MVWEDSRLIQAVCSVPAQIGSVKQRVWIQEGFIGFSNSLYFQVQQRSLKLNHPGFIHSRWTLWTHKVTYPEYKRTGVLGLPPDDNYHPSDEQQQQHSHCCEHGVSREHTSGPRGQDQAQDAQQENCKGQGGGEQAGPRNKDVRTLGHTPPQAAHLRKGQCISKTPPQLPKTQNPNLSCQFQNMTKEKSHCSPSRETHPQTICPDIWVGVVLVGNHRLFRIIKGPASGTGSERLAS